MLMPFPSPVFLLRTSSALMPISEREEEAAAGGGGEKDILACDDDPTPHYPSVPSQSPMISSSVSRSQTDSTPRIMNRAFDGIWCRPSIVPIVDSSTSSPGNSSDIVRTLFSSLSCKNIGYSSGSTSSAVFVPNREDWKRATSQLSRRLTAAAKKRDEAIQEASQLREAVLEMEKKIARLEAHNNELRSALHRFGGAPAGAVVDPSFPASEFLAAVIESRTMTRHLCRFIAAKVCQTGRTRMLDRIADVLHKFDVDMPVSTVGRNSSKIMVFYLEGIMSLLFYGDFESPVFERNGAEKILDPFSRCEANRRAYRELKGLTWEGVLLKGTKHYSEELSRFCDRKMSEVVEMLGWSRSWPEPLLQAFFGVTKWVWLVHLLARSVQPSVPLLRVRKGELFDQRYMEDALGGRAEQVRVDMVVAPGFYVYSGVIKCKVICR